MTDTKKAAEMEANARLEDDCLDQATGGTGYYLPWYSSTHNGQSAEGSPLNETTGGHYMQVKDKYGMDFYQPSGEVKKV